MERMVLPIGGWMERVVLPIGRKIVIKPGERWCGALHVPHGKVWQPERLFISGAGTAGGAGDWVIHELLWNGRSQLLKRDVSGALFATNVVEKTPWIGDAMQPADIGMIAVSYCGDNPCGVPFYASLVGVQVEVRESVIAP